MAEYVIVEDHPLAGEVSPNAREDMIALVPDVQKNGLQRPIILYEGKILEGRTRYRACLFGQVEPRYKNYTGDDPEGFVAKQRKRHARSRLARALHVSERKIGMGITAMKRGTPELQQAVLAMNLTYCQAERISRLPYDMQNAVLAAGGKKERASAIRQAEDDLQTSSPFARDFLDALERLYKVCEREGMIDPQEIMEALREGVDWESDDMLMHAAASHSLVGALEYLRAESAAIYAQPAASDPAQGDAEP